MYVVKMIFLLNTKVPIFINVHCCHIFANLEKTGNLLSANANPPFPNMFAQVMTGSNKIYKAVIREDISAVKPNWLSKIGSITIIPPPGIAATENFAMTK